MSKVCEDLMNQVHKKRVEYVWHVTQEQLRKLRHEKDECLSFLLMPDPSGNSPRLLGFRIIIVPWHLDQPELAIILPPDTACYGDEDWVHSFGELNKRY